MGSNNVHVITKGRLIKDPVTKEVNGNSLVELVVADNPWGKDKERYKGMIITAAFGRGAAQSAAGLRKGDFVGFHGALLMREYEGKNGKGVAFEIKYPEGLTTFAARDKDAPEDGADEGPAAPPPKASGGFDFVA